MLRRPLVIDNITGELTELSSGSSLYLTQVFREHFFGNLPNSWGTSNAGGGSSTTVNSTNAIDSFGIITHSTGTTTTGRAAIHTGQNMTRLGGFSTHVFGGVFRIPVLSVATQRFTIRQGLSTAVTAAGNPVAGLYIRLVDNVNAGRIQLVGRNASTESVFNSTVTIAANDWVEWFIVVNNTLNFASLYIGLNGATPTLQGSITTNIPADTNVLGFYSLIQKSVGTTARTIDVDIVEYHLV